MAERPSRKTLTADELVLQKLKETFERNGNVTADSNGTNVWVMLAASEAFSDLLAENLPYPLSDQKPTHRVRVVLRTTDAQSGTNPYVDGSDFFLAVDEQLLTKFGQTGVVQLGKAVPLIGGGIGALFDGVSTNIIGNVARDTFVSIPD